MSLVDTYHAYVYGTSFWYFLRASMRIINPSAVISWFRPPIDRLLEPNDLELYTTRTDAFGLLTLAALLLVLSDAVPLHQSLVGSSFATSGGGAAAKKPYARAAIILTIFHHVTTGLGSFQHWYRPSHRTVAMDIGVWGNLALTVLGIVALVYGVEGSEGVKKPVGGTPRKGR